MDSLTKYTITLTAGCVAGLAFIFPSLWFIAWLGLGVFFFILWFAVHSVRESIIHGFLFGIITASAGIGWFWDSYPITWTNDGVVVQILAIGIIWALISFMLSLGTVLVAPIFFFVRTLPIKILTLPLLGGIIWVIQEYIRMVMYAFVTIARDSLLGAHFSVTAFGYSFAEHSYLLQFADWSGIYSLSFAVAVLAGYLAVAVHALIQKHALTVLSACTLSVLFLLLPLLLTEEHKSFSKPLIIAAISLNNNEPSYPVFINSALEEIIKNNADVVVFPEGVTPQQLTTSDGREALRAALGKKNPLFIYSRYNTSGDEEGYANLIYQYADGRSLQYQKQLLMPLGEYIPTFTKVVFAPLANTRIEHRTNLLAGLISKGTESAPVVEQNGVHIGALLCSESLSPLLYNELANKGALILVNLSSITWFHESERVSHMLTNLAKVHAVQHRKYFVLASKGGVSSIVDPSGEIIAQSEHNHNSILIQTLPH